MVINFKVDQIFSSAYYCYVTTKKNKLATKIRDKKNKTRH